MKCINGKLEIILNQTTFGRVAWVKRLSPNIVGGKAKFAENAGTLRRKGKPFLLPRGFPITHENLGFYSKSAYWKGDGKRA